MKKLKIKNGCKFRLENVFKILENKHPYTLGETMKAVDNLKEYIEIDEIYQNYKKGIEPSHNDRNTDFEWFCINHCRDIEKVLNKIEKQKNEIEFLKWDNNDKHGIEISYLDLQERVNKAIEKLICWGEALDPIFQKEMLDILENK